MSSFEDIVQAIQSRPEIWQSSHPLYHNKAVKKMLWRQISNELNSNETIIRKRWKHLMDQYRKELKKMAKLKTYQGEPVRCPWVHYESLAFLKDEMLMRKERDRNKLNAGSESDENQHQEDTEYDSSLWKYTSQPVTPTVTPTATQAVTHVTTTSTNITKADLILKRLQSISTVIAKSYQKEEQKNDEDYMFFMSVMPMVKNLSAVKKLQFRMKVNEFLLQTMAEADPLNNIEYERHSEPEDSKEGVKLMQTDNNI